MNNELKLNKKLFIFTIIFGVLSLGFDFLSDVISVFDSEGKMIASCNSYFLIHSLALFVVLISFVLVFTKTANKNKGGKNLNLTYLVYLFAFGLGKLITLLDGSEIKCLPSPIVWATYILSINIVVPILLLILFRRNFNIYKKILFALTILNSCFLIGLLILGIIKNGTGALLSPGSFYVIVSIIYFALMNVSLLKEKEDYAE